MVLSATLSKPTKKQLSFEDFVRVKIKLSVSSNMEQGTYLAEFYTKTQVFHKKNDFSGSYGIYRTEHSSKF